MKKIVVLILALLCVSLCAAVVAACGSDNRAQNGDNPSAELPDNPGGDDGSGEQPGQPEEPVQRIAVSAYIDGSLYRTIYTSSADGYKIELPAVEDDITTNPNSERYFYGWFVDRNFQTPVTDDTVFNKDTSIYGTWIDVFSNQFIYDVNRGEATIIGFTSNTATVVVVPCYLNSFPVTTIGEEAFKDKTMIRTLIICDGIETIEKNAFQNCNSIEKVILPNSLTTIGGFAECSNLTSIEIPDGVTRIGESAFQNCTALTSIYIPAGVTRIDNQAFSGCNGLTGVYIEDLAAWCSMSFYSVPNPLYYAHNLYLNGRLIADLVIPDGVTTIGSYAFYNCNSLVSVTIPASVTEIDSNAFRDCSGLTKVTIGSCVTDIGNSAFSGCIGLTDIAFSDSVTSIGSYAFSDCTGLRSIEIPDSVINIEDNAFKNCVGLTNVVFGKGLSKIGSSAFCSCTGLTSVTLPDSLTSIGKSAFEDCVGLTSITLRNGLSEIGDYAFCNCTGLTGITIPASVTKIGSYAFSNCNGFTSIEVPNSAASIGSSAFSGCSGLEKTILPINLKVPYGYIFGTSYYSGSIEIRQDGQTYYFPASLKTVTVTGGTVPNYAFYGCSGLTNIILLNGVTTIGSSAFCNCESLTSIEIPNSVTSIGSSAFYNCTGLTSIEIPGSVTSIGGSAFSGCNKLVSMTVPFVGGGNSKASDSGLLGYIFGTISYSGGTATKQGYYATAKTYYIPTTLAHVTIGNGAKSIESYAFNNCKLTSVAIGSGVEAIKTDAFLNCQLTNVYINDISAWCNISFSEYSESLKYNENPLSIAQNLYLNGKIITDLIIPEGVTHINSFAFCNYEKLISVTIPETVTSIGNGVFRYCTNLTEIKYNAKAVDDFQDTSDVFCNAGTAGEGITVTFGDTVEKIPAYLFCVSSSSYIPKIISVTIGENVNSIGDYAFYNCSGLTSMYYNAKAVYDLSYQNEVFYMAGSGGKGLTVNFGNTVEKIPAYLFMAGRTKVIEVTIEKGVTSIGQCAFSHCTNMTRVTIPESVTVIENGAFNYCTSLKSIEIPYSVVSIGDSAFDYCSGLGSISVSSDNMNFFSDGNCLIEKASRTLLFGSNKSVIPADGSVTNIGDRAFSGRSGLANITIPESITSIGDEAFSGCSGLTTINYNAKSVDDLSRSSNLFSRAGSNGSGITVFFGNTVERIPAYLFYLSSYGMESHLPNVINVTISESVTSIGMYAFYGCINLKSVTFENPDGWWYASYIEATSGTSIPSTTLSKPSAAAACLKTNYYKYYWKRS